MSLEPRFNREAGFHRRTKWLFFWIAIIIFILWLLSPAEAQRDRSADLDRQPAVSRVVTNEQSRDCKFVIVECTGNSWWYDNGWESGERSYSGSFVRDPAWQAITR